MSEAMDNFEVRVTARSREAMRHALALIAMDTTKIEGWSVKDGKLLLWWSLGHTKPEDGVSRFMTPTSAADCTDVVMLWLQDNPPKSERPDIDGSVSRGWQLRSERGGWSYVACTIEPVWALHGK